MPKLFVIEAWSDMLPSETTTHQPLLTRSLSSLNILLYIHIYDTYQHTKDINGISSDYSSDYVCPDYSSDYVCPDYSSDYVCPDYCSDYVCPDYSSDYVCPDYSSDYVCPDYSSDNVFLTTVLTMFVLKLLNLSTFFFKVWLLFFK